jgi:hypothetical protein
MKKQLLIISALILQGYCIAQPILNATDYATNYAATTYNGSSTTLTAGNAGSNQIWDVSSLTLTQDGAESSIPIGTAPFANSFPSANYCIKTVGSGWTDYALIKVSATSFEFLASVSDTSIDIDFTPDTSIFF